MAAQVAQAPGTSKNKTSDLPSNLSQDINSGKSLRETVHGSGTIFGTGDGTSDDMNNVDRHHHELNMANTARSSTNNSDLREKESASKSASLSASNSGMSSSMETGLIANHKLKNVGGGDPPPPPHHHAHSQQQQQPFNQFQPHHQRQIQNNNINSQQSAQGETGIRQHGGKENILGNRVERHQQLLNKSEEDDHPCKSGDRMGSRYDHAGLGATNNFISSNQPQSAGGNSNVSEFNNYYGGTRGGPCLDQHGGQQSPGMGVMHSSAPNSMDQVQNSHEGYHNSQYNHYQNYRAGYGAAGYGMMTPSLQGNSMMGPSSNSAASHSKASMAAAASGSGGNVGGFQRFPGQSQQRPSGATPTLNELLTSPSPVMRGYGSGYQDYNNNPSAQQASMGLGKDMGAQYGSASHGWGGQQRNHPAMSPGNNGQGVTRSQVAPMESMAMKRSHLYGMGGSPYSQHQQGGAYHGQPYGSPAPHQYPMGTQGRGQVGMSGMQYPPQQMATPYGHQAMGGFCQQAQPPYFSQPMQPAAQPPYAQPRAPPPQEISSDSYGSMGQTSVTAGKPNEDLGLTQEDRPSSLPDLSGSIDDLPTGTEVGLGASASQGQPSTFSPGASPHLAGSRPSPPPPVGPTPSRQGPLSPAAGPGTQLAQQSVGGVTDAGTHATMSQSPMSQERGFTSSIQRNVPSSQFTPQQPGPPISPRPMHHIGGPYQQGGAGGPTYGHHGGQYGPQGNYPRLPGYGGAPAASYGVPGSGVGSSPMHGQGPGQPCGSMPAGRGVGMAAGVGSRPYPGNTGGLAPGSPGMPQPSGPGMGRPQPSGGRKSQEVAVSAMQAGGSTTASRQGSYPGVNHMGMIGSAAPYSQPVGNSSGRMTPQAPPYNAPPSGPLPAAADGMMPLDPKQKLDSKEESAGLEPQKAKDGYLSRCPSRPPTPSALSPSPASLSSYHGDDSDSISSPAWPRTPSSPQKPNSSSTLSGEKITKLYQMGVEPERQAWVERYLAFMEDRGTPVTSLPSVGRKPLDLCRLYMCVKEIGGLATVNKTKKWRELSSHLNMGASNSVASSLKKHYIQYLFAFECQVERGEEPPPEIFAAADSKKQQTPKIQPPSPANSGSLQGPHTPQSTGSSSVTEAGGDLKPPTPAPPTPAPHTQMIPQQGGRNSSTVSVQDPFAEVNDPIFQKCTPMNPGAPYHPQGGNMPEAVMRMQYEANKDPFGAARKGMAPSEHFGDGHMAGSGMQEAYGRGPPPGAMPAPGVGQRPQYPYGPGYDRRPDHVMGPEGGIVPHQSQNNMVPSANDSGLYPPNRYPSQLRHEGYGQQYSHGMPYGAHQPGMFPQQQGYKRPMEGMYAPPAKRHEGDVYAGPYGGQQSDSYGPYGSYSGPERRPMQNPFPYAYGRERMPPSGPVPPHAMGSGEGPQPRMWPSRTDVNFPYPSRHGQGVTYPLGRGDEGEGLPGQDSSWSGATGQRQPSFHPSATSPSSSSGPMPHMSTRPPPPSSYQTPPAMAASHIPRDPSPAPFQRSMEVHPSTSKGHFVASVKPAKLGMPVPMPGPPPAPGMPGQAPPPVLQREVNYPPSSVEGTQALLKPRRKLTSKDTGTPEAWRVMMSLKSGLLAESTWALDTINVLLYDDSTVASFTLSQLPGFLELIVEYFRRCLIEMFGILKEYEVGTPGQKTLLGPAPSQKEEDPAHLEEMDQSEAELGEEDEGAANDEALLSTTEEAEPDNIREEPPGEPHLKGMDEEEHEEKSKDFSEGTCPLEPRPKQASRYDKFPLKVEDNDWDGPHEDLLNGEGFTSGLLHWQAGGGDSTAHIQTHFERKTSSLWGREEEPEPAETSEKTCHNRAAWWPPVSFEFDTLEDEPRCRDDAPLSVAANWQDSLARRCICISNVVRGLSFVPGNDTEMSRHPGLVLILGRLVLLHHEHLERKRPLPIRRDGDRDGEEEDHGLACSRDEWRWDCLATLRENTMVTLANIAGQLDLSPYPESICLPLLDGLLHWMVCPSAESRDPFPMAGPYSALTPQRLVLECLCKLSVQDGNVDLLLATPPMSRQQRLYTALVRHVGERRSQVCREMAVAVLSNLARGDPTAARAIALQRGGVGSLIGFLEDGVAVAQYQHGPHGPPHPEPPSVSMMCRAAKALLAMAEVEENRSEFVLYEGRLLDITVSSVLNAAVSSILCQVLFKIGRF
ncbi:AT-rich interactive domain-containing protein 1B-like isoform X2 [Paramormyrops kingsleyae]|uniref:AT-rich interactive domain-containing protein 1B-like isoform X2 n=1 Tax=Paramormyrops kingsleyae TaxID=1676925 RepID=UPI003B978B86